jgi:hypothetical protein
MCPTIRGRIHTRVASLALPAVLAVILALVTGRPAWIGVLAVMLVIGIALDVLVYPRLIAYQPPWLTGVIGLAELGYLFVLLHLLAFGLADAAAIGFYAVSWSLAVATRVALLPIFSLTYLESAGEFRPIRWTIPDLQQQVPVLATVTQLGPGTMLRPASGSRPAPLEPMPSFAPSPIPVAPASPAPPP